MNRFALVAALILLPVSTLVTARTIHAARTTDAERGAAASASFKFMVLLTRHDTLSYEQYERYFFETHLPYVLKIPGVRGYTVNMRLPGDTAAPYDGISEFWFDDRAAFDRAMASPEAQASLADAARFLTPQIMLVDERVSIPLQR